MATTPRRPLLAFSLLLLALVLAGPAARDFGAPVAHAAGTETFTNPSPPKLYAQDPSHQGLADANPAGGTNGYCVFVENEGNVAVPDNLAADPPIIDGFSVIDGVILDTDVYTGNAATTTDDVYCVIIASDPGVSSMLLQWTFTDGETGGQAELPLQVVEVALDGADGFVGSPALVCTVGWDPQFLTGAASNAGGTNPVDVVETADWSTSAGAIFGDPFKVGGEWCVNVDAASEQLDVQVTFAFDAVYNCNTAADDTSHVVMLDAPDGLINIFAEPDYSELRHIAPSGRSYPDHVSDPLAIFGRHTACIIPSTENDVLTSSGVYFSGVPASGVQIFNNGDGIDVPGILEGTICLRWTAQAAGPQFLTVEFEKVDGDYPGTRMVGWDSNDDGNDDDPETSGPSNFALIMDWRDYGRAEITRSDTFDQDTVVTNSTIDVPIQLNVADGTYTFTGGPVLPLYAWVFGPEGERLTGVEMQARILSTCGNFVNESDIQEILGKTVDGRSNDGRFDRIDLGATQPELYGDGPDDLLVSILNDGGCNPGATIDLEIDTWLLGGQVLETTTLTIRFIPATPGTIRVPQVAWAGETVDITFALAYSGDVCPLEDNTIHFTADASNVGMFLSHGNMISVDAGHISGAFGEECTRTVRFQSFAPGEVSIHAFVDGAPLATASYLFYFLAIEDVSLTATPQLYVSERGSATAAVRGWFPGSNQSTRPERDMGDGRVLPEHRWVLPDDWHLLRGNHDFMPAWPTSPAMPSADITFFMEREEVVNDYSEGPHDGALGWFLPTGGEWSLDVNPRTGQPSALGSTSRPRIISASTAPDGTVTVDTFGDFNVAYTDCPANPPTGNPHCDIDDFVGLTDFYAIADVPVTPGHEIPVRSNNAATEWLWAGYKRVTVVDTESTAVKYVVAHLRDRDGFCDAIGLNNALGVRVDFQIEGADGRILEVAGELAFVSSERKRASGRTFDLLDNQGNPINVELAQPAFFADECQAWIRITNSLHSPMSVTVTFPTTPAPIPGNVRITGLVCSGDESVTVTNVGDNAVSLAGFGLNSRRVNPFQEPEHLQLDGVLEPGESATFPGGPNAADHGWINTSGDVFTTGGAILDWASLTWNGFVVSRAFCDGTFTHADLPEELPPSGEGPIAVTIPVNFHAEGTVDLVTGWNLVTAGEGLLDALMSEHAADVVAIYGWHEIEQRWEHLFPSGPAYVNTLHEMAPGRAYWVQVNRSFTVTYAP